MIESRRWTLPGTEARLAVHSWVSDKPGWIALFSHAYAEHAGRYHRLAEKLAASRAVVCAVDMAGHGDSEGEPGVVEDVEHLVGDLETLRRRVVEWYPGLPVVSIGHGLGGTVAVRHAQEYQEHLVALVLSAPVLGTFNALDLLADERIPRTPVDPANLSRDPEVGREYLADPLVYHGPFPRSTLTAVAKMLRTIGDGPTLAVPTLWLHGENDELVPEADTREGMERLRGPEFHEHGYAGARHDLFHETNAEEVLHDVVTFIGRELNT
ncbi:Serine aminopeptidase, S33 [Actinopolyspora xinjiangensis]|uniref:Serine aminopeptidase, S33 n=1 Tax=Actinopolyspora xinjiangensis TaxID=405564 RepID=A0A1H0NY73_9ACTN|nr:alpha/beta fold hydrolase [Actinopolyspora xinjiangensis]SDO97727.1 Serine aminopeptidase, S33 [Actinopolyspora xinjiangensis]